MLTDVRNGFVQRKIEVDTYVEFISLTDGDLVQIFAETGDDAAECELDSDLKVLLRAHTVMLLYNLVESTVIALLSAVREELVRQRVPYSGACEGLRKSWRRIHCRDMQDAKENRWVDGIGEMLDHALRGDVLEIDVEKLKRSFAGSIDAAKVREISANLGIGHVLRSQSAGGASLLTIKNNRNALAHGGKTFVECGRDLSLVDLIGFRDEVHCFIEDIIRNTEEYVAKRNYLLVP